MLKAVSQFSDFIDLHVSIWFPAFFKSYREGENLTKAKAHWQQVMEHLARLDVLFIAGGDPGGHYQKVLLREITPMQAKHCRETWP